MVAANYLYRRLPFARYRNLVGAAGDFNQLAGAPLEVFGERTLDYLPEAMLEEVSPSVQRAPRDGTLDVRFNLHFNTNAQRVVVGVRMNITRAGVEILGPMWNQSYMRDQNGQLESGVFGSDRFEVLTGDEISFVAYRMANAGPTSFQDQDTYVLFEWWD